MNTNTLCIAPDTDGRDHRVYTDEKAGVFFVKRGDGPAAFFTPKMVRVASHNGNAKGGPVEVVYCGPDEGPGEFQVTVLPLRGEDKKPVGDEFTLVLEEDSMESLLAELKSLRPARPKPPPVKKSPAPKAEAKPEQKDEEKKPAPKKEKASKPVPVKKPQQKAAPHKEKPEPKRDKNSESRFVVKIDGRQMEFPSAAAMAAFMRELEAPAPKAEAEPKGGSSRDRGYALCDGEKIKLRMERPGPDPAIVTNAKGRRIEIPMRYMDTALRFGWAQSDGIKIKITEDRQLMVVRCGEIELTIGTRHVARQILNRDLPLETMEKATPRPPKKAKDKPSPRETSAPPAEPQTPDEHDEAQLLEGQRKTEAEPAPPDAVQTHVSSLQKKFGSREIPS